MDSVVGGPYNLARPVHDPEATMTEWWKGFQDIDSSPESGKFLNFMDLANSNKDILRYRELMTELCPIGEGSQILDVGCGLGQEAQRLARQVGLSGRVVGIDRSELMVREASSRAEATGLPLEFLTADVHQLEFDDNSFDLSRAERVLVYIENPAQAIQEMARVVKPGGHVMAYEFDFTGTFIDSDLEELTRRIENALLSGPPNPLVSRQLPYLFRKAGLSIERIEPFTVRMQREVIMGAYTPPLIQAVEAGKISQQELDVWWKEQELIEQNGQSFFGHSGFVVVGAKR